MDTDALVAQVAERQHGLITRAQAIEAGLDRSAINRRVQRGRWKALRSGVYVIAGAPPSERQAVLAVCLAGTSGVTASHLTAARLWGFDLPAPAEIEIHGHVRMQGIRSHRRRRSHQPIAQCSARFR